MVLFLLLVAYGLVWATPPIVRLLRGGHGRFPHEAPPSKAVQLLQLLLSAHAVLMSTSAIYSYISSDHVEAGVAAVLGLVSLVVLGSFRCPNAPVPLWGRACMSVTGFVAWPAVLFARGPALPRLLGVLMAHALGAFVMDVMLCPPVLTLLLTLGAVGVPAGVCWGWDPGAPGALVEGAALLVLPLVGLGGGAHFYLRCLRGELQCAHADHRDAREALDYVVSSVGLIRDGLADEALDDLLDAVPALCAPPLPGGDAPRLGVRHIAPFNVASLLSAVVDAFGAAPGIAVALRTTVAATDMLVGPAFRIQQVLTIAVGNAVRANRSSSVLLRADSSVVTSATGLSSARLRLCVHEVGAALPPHYLALLVGVLHSDAPDMAAGQEALDLWICHRLVAMLGGVMEVAATETGPDPGVRVTFDLHLQYWLDADLTEKLGLDSCHSTSYSMPLTGLAQSPPNFSFSQSGSWGSANEGPRPPSKATEGSPALDGLEPLPTGRRGSSPTPPLVASAGQPAEETALQLPAPGPSPAVWSPALALPGPGPTRPHDVTPQRGAQPPPALRDPDAGSNAADDPCAPLQSSRAHDRWPRAGRPPPESEVGHRSPPPGPFATPQGPAAGALNAPEPPPLSLKLNLVVPTEREPVPGPSGSPPSKRSDGTPLQSVRTATPPEPEACGVDPAPPPTSDSDLRRCNSQLALLGRDDPPNPLQPTPAPRTLTQWNRRVHGLIVKSFSSGHGPRPRREAAARGGIAHSQSLPLRPRSPRPPPAAASPPIVSPSGLPPEADTRFLTRAPFGLLFVSSDLASLRAMGDLCRSLGLTAMWAAVDTDSAMDAFERHLDIAVVIMDQGDQLLRQRMALAERLRQRAGGRQLLVVSLVLVLDARLLRLVSDFPLGLVDYFFAKPLSAAKLLDALRQSFAPGHVGDFQSGGDAARAMAAVINRMSPP